MPTHGRGGAGNILADADVQAINQRTSHDLEANQQAAEDYTAARRAKGSSKVEQQYQSTGRGGAGNFLYPSTLDAASMFFSPGVGADTAAAEPLSSTGDPSTTPSTTKSNTRAHRENVSSTAAEGAAASKVPPSHLPAYVGRGGAGNYLGEGGGEGGAKDPLEREFELQQMKVQAGVERDVERGLSKPPAAHLGEGKEVVGKGGVGNVNGK